MKLQFEIQILELSNTIMYSLELSNTIMDEEKNDLEGKIAELEAQRSITNKQAKELKVRVAKMEAHNSSLEVLLK